MTVNSVAAGVGESTINLRPGERITVRELIEAALIQSANDAAWRSRPESEIATSASSCPG